MEDLTKKIATFSLGFNFCDNLINGVIRLNKLSDDRRISELFGALSNSPLHSARPSGRIPDVSLSLFSKQVATLKSHGIGFNYLFNTQQELTENNKEEFYDFLKFLSDIGVESITCGNIEVAKFIKKYFPDFRLILSITFGLKAPTQLQKVESALFDSVYLDGSFVNRDFQKIRQFVKKTSLQIRLYANLSCIANCPVIREHYNLFSKPSGLETIKQNDNYFKGCALVKISNPLEFIQVPWIRPEDISVYMDEGVRHFKLSDRLSSTEVLLKIAKAYILKKSTDNLFELIERNGDKFRFFNLEERPDKHIQINSRRIPADFIEHFRKGECTSSNKRCAYCNDVAKKAVQINGADSGKILNRHKIEIDSKLIRRINTT